MTNHVKVYLESLLKREQIKISESNLTYFEEFANHTQVVEAYNVIQINQKFMVEAWQEKSKIEDVRNKFISLPNATVGKPYSFTFDLDKLDLTEVGAYEFIIDEKLGVIFDQELSQLIGVPQERGEHTIILNFRLKGYPDDRPYSEKALKMIVNPDPRSLWQDLKADPSAPYQTLDTKSGSHVFGNRKLVVASKRGRSHAHEGKFRDDSFDFAYFADSNWSFIALADGAGSAKFSRKGAELACTAIPEYFRENLTQDRLIPFEACLHDYASNLSEDSLKKISSFLVEHVGKAAFSAQSKIKEEAQIKQTELRDYATTLLFAMVKEFDFGHVIASFWVGDGGIGIYQREENEVIVMGTPDSGEFAGQTRFLTMSDIFADNAYVNRIRFKIVKNFTALVLMTDGVTDPKFQTDANLNKVEKWNTLWEDLNGENLDHHKVDFSKPLPDVENDLLAWLDFWSAGNHDDRTIAILY